MTQALPASATSLLPLPSDHGRMWGHLFLKDPRSWSTSLQLLLLTPQPLFSEIRILWGPTGNRQVLTYPSYPHPPTPPKAGPGSAPHPRRSLQAPRLSRRFPVYPFQARAGPPLFSWPGGGPTVPFAGLLTSRLRPSSHPFLPLSVPVWFTSFPTRISRRGDPHVPRPGTGYSARRQPYKTHRLDGGRDQGGGGESLLPRNGGDGYSAGRGPDRGRRSGGVCVNWSAGKRATRKRQGSGAAVDVGR